MKWRLRHGKTACHMSNTHHPQPIISLKVETPKVTYEEGRLPNVRDVPSQFNCSRVREQSQTTFGIWFVSFFKKALIIPGHWLISKVMMAAFSKKKRTVV